MKPQNFEAKRAGIVKAFEDQLNKNRVLLKQRIKLSWSNWGFGLEPLATTARRLSRNGIEWIELHGNRYGQRGTATRNRVSLKFLVEHEFNNTNMGGINAYETISDRFTNNGMAGIPSGRF